MEPIETQSIYGFVTFLMALNKIPKAMNDKKFQVNDELLHTCQYNILI